MIATLLDAGADARIQTIDGWTPIDLTLQAGMQDLRATIKQFGNRDSDFWRALDFEPIIVAVAHTTEILNEAEAQVSRRELQEAGETLVRASQFASYATSVISGQREPHGAKYAASLAGAARSIGPEGSNEGLALSMGDGSQRLGNLLNRLRFITKAIDGVISELQVYCVQPNEHLAREVCGTQ